MADKKQLTHMSQFSIIRELPGDTKSHDKSIIKKQPHQKTSELKFKIEPIGIQPEDDDDLETCPSRTRTSWPHQIVPWWKPADRFEKPPYSYATLIAHAILASKDGRLTLSDIYKWISEAYPYYKRGQKGWQNSIRHNLSLNKKWFVKFDRRPTQAHPGKGGYWTLQMNMEKIFVDNLSQAGGHSRRHHDMGMYTSLSTQYYRNTSEDSNEMFDDESNANAMCPNILITVPADYEAKKTKSTNHVVSAPRIRNMTSQEKSSLTPIATSATPKTFPKKSIIRFNPSSDLKRRKPDPARPAPKPGKKHNKVEPGSSTSEEGRDSAVELDMDEPISKKRKSKTTNSNDSTESPMLFYPDVVYNDHNMVRPEDLIGIMNLNNDPCMYSPPEVSTNEMMFDTNYTVYDKEAQRILDGLRSSVYDISAPQDTDMKTIDLQNDSLDKSVHFPTRFDSGQFSGFDDQMFLYDLDSYNMDQYIIDIDTSGMDQYIDTSKLDDSQPSDLLLETQFNVLDSYWDASRTNFINYEPSNPMPL